MENPIPEFLTGTIQLSDGYRLEVTQCIVLSNGNCIGTALEGPIKRKFRYYPLNGLLRVELNSFTISYFRRPSDNLFILDEPQY